MANDTQPLHKKGGQGSSLPPEPLPARRRCTSYHVFKILSLVYAFLFTVIGAILTGLAVWVIVIKKDIESFDDIVSVPVILLLLAGIIILVTALVGCIGACADKLWPLRIFLGVVVIVFILQVVVGIVAYIYREEAIDDLGDRMKFAVIKYKESNRIMKAVDKIQTQWQCCGIEDANDWTANKEYVCPGSARKEPCSVPDSCCVVPYMDCGSERELANGIRSEKIHSDGCKDDLKTWVEGHLDAIGATALAMAIIHILGMFVVFMFITKIEDRIRLFKYRKRFYN